MPKTEASLMLYAVDLDELREWVGCKDEARLKEALELIGGDEDSAWEGDLRPVLERLLHRVTMEGKLYEDLVSEDRYYLTQLLIDLFDEYIDAEPLSEELPLAGLLELVKEAPKGSAVLYGLEHLVRGRQLGGAENLWTGGPFEESQPYLGFVTRAEAARFADALDELARRQAGGGARPPRGRPSGLLKKLAASARECAETEFDLVSFVG